VHELAKLAELRDRGDISADEYQRLLAAKPTVAEAGLSGFGKARAIVLNFIAPPGGDDNKPSPSSTCPPSDMRNIKL